jgi:hypothetical protein
MIVSDHVSVGDEGFGHDEVHVADKFDLEVLLCELALDSLKKAREATEQQEKAEESKKRDWELQTKVLRSCDDLCPHLGRGIFQLDSSASHANAS